MKPDTHRSRWRRSAVAAAWLAVALGVPPLPALAAALPGQVAWQAAASDGDVERAFQRARAERKPVLLYWGASWCPPCNQLKATLFNRDDFAALARGVVPVHVDGDRPGAQKLADRFGVRGYPTLVLLRADGTELTRLPGEADAPQVISLLQSGLAGGRPARSVLADARAGRALSAAEWRMLAFRSDEFDPEPLLPAATRAAVLSELATRAAAGGADADTPPRLLLKALAAGARPDAGQRDRLLRLLDDRAAARAQADVLINEAESLAKALAGDEAPAASAATSRLDAALRLLQADTGLSRADRAGALIARVQLARLGQPAATTTPQLPEALLRDVGDAVARLDRETVDPWERQAVIPTLAYLLAQAGRWAESDALLRGNLARTTAPYYLMSQLAGNARALGQTAEALRWYRQAYDRSEGAATRLQWGAAYLGALVDLAPDDGVRVEQVAAQLLDEAAAAPDAFHQRSGRSMTRIAQKLAAWGAARPAAAAPALQRLQARLGTACRARDARDGQRAACEAVRRTLAGDVSAGGAGRG